MINQVVLVGKVAKMPVMKEGSAGVKISTCVLEIEKGFKNGLGVFESDFVTIVMWPGIAMTMMDVAKIGSMVSIKGRLQSHTFETSEKQRITLTEVIAEKVGYLDKHLMKIE